MAVSNVTEPTFSPGVPERLFTGPYVHRVAATDSYDVLPDGQRFLMIEEDPSSSQIGPLGEVHFIQNWTEELKRLVPTDQ